MHHAPISVSATRLPQGKTECRTAPQRKEKLNAERGYVEDKVDGEVADKGVHNAGNDDGRRVERGWTPANPTRGTPPCARSTFWGRDRSSRIRPGEARGGDDLADEVNNLSARRPRAPNSGG